jgi:hypothetical protein
MNEMLGPIEETVRRHNPLNPGLSVGPKFGVKTY